ncbi:hydrogenase formation protein HypD [Candidatus Bathyarchaeota archaeon]|nr:MAG: hydrogenase formation protein HypD [Candidatus Bathyarchaeota archaeon]
MDGLTSRFRDPSLAKRVIEKIRKLAPPYTVRFCHVCGTHEYTITHYGLRSLLPETVDVIAGPGCPVCVTPAFEIDRAVSLALKGVTVLTFGDVIRVPGSEISLLDARARGGDVRVVYGVGDAVRIAREEPDKEFVFLAIGFETTAPSTANEILNGPPENLSFLIVHRLIPPVMELLLGIGDLQIDGFIAPGHVSTIIGMKPYRIFPEAYRMPTVIAGFEPLDVLFGILMLLRQVREEEARLENEYTRSVTWEGNVKAQRLIHEAFDVESGYWRGLGRIPSSALRLKDEFSEYDAKRKYDITVGRSRELMPGCLCHLVMIGKIKPPECPLFMKACTPQKPKGACMVSVEGTCSIWAKHGVRGRLRAQL